MAKKYTAKDIERMQIIEYQMKELLSLEMSVIKADGSEDGSLLDIIEDKGPALQDIVEDKLMSFSLGDDIKKYLSPKEYQIILLRYGLENDIPMTLEQIGAKYGVTRERIRQVEAKALKKLRTKMKRGKYGIK